MYVETAPTITNPVTDTPTQGQRYTYQVDVTAYDFPFSYSATHLPSWLSIDTTAGALTGVPPAPGTYVFNPIATNLSGSTGLTVTLNVSGAVAGSPVITSATTANATAGTAFNYQITANNSTASTTYSALTLPPGLLFNSGTGALSGTPTTAGTYLVPISATSGSLTYASILTITISPTPAPVLAGSLSLSAPINSTASYSIPATGIVSSYALTSGSLPAGLSLNPSTGVISGTPSVSGTYQVTISASNGTGAATTTLTINTRLLATVTLGNLFAIYDGTTKSVTATTNPTNLNAVTITYNGSSTAPSAAGSYPVVATVNDPNYQGSATGTLTISVGTATPQNDGVPNLLKYLCDINPTRPMIAADRAALPTLGTMTMGNSPYLTLTYRQYSSETGITINVEISNDLKTWTTLTNPTIIQTGTDTTKTPPDPIMQVQVPASGTKQFLRLNVTSP